MINAIAYSSYHGLVNQGDVPTREPEMANARLPLCLELVDHKDKLEEFCRKHGNLLQGKALVYMHVEQWSFLAHKLTAVEVVRDE